MNIRKIKNCAVAIVCIGACAGGALSYANGQKEKIEDHIVFLNAPSSAVAADETSKSGSGASGSVSSSETEITADSDNSSAVSTDGRIHLNSATRQELMSLPGIGATKADAILEYRKAYGAFKSIEEITEVKGIGEGIYNKIKDQIAL